MSGNKYTIGLEIGGKTVGIKATDLTGLFLKEPDPREVPPEEVHLTKADDGTVTIKNRADGFWRGLYGSAMDYEVAISPQDNGKLRVSIQDIRGIQDSRELDETTRPGVEAVADTRKLEIRLIKPGAPKPEWMIK